MNCHVKIMNKCNARVTNFVHAKDVVPTKGSQCKVLRVSLACKVILIYAAKAQSELTRCKYNKFPLMLFFVLQTHSIVFFNMVAKLFV